MESNEELNIFIEKADDVINCKYILADLKIAGLLKAIACSKTLIAIMKNSLKNFELSEIMEECFVISDENENKKEFVAPTSTSRLIALTFSLLVEIDSNKINFGDFLKNYFYGDGSVFSCYTLFVSNLIRPFKNAVKVIFEGIISGRIRNPEEEINIYKKEKTISKTLDEEEKVNEESLIKAKEFLKENKNKILISGLNEESLVDSIFIIDGMINAITDVDKVRIKELYTGYKYFLLIYKRLEIDISYLGKLLKEGNAL